jgi:hypothetical protein
MREKLTHIPPHQLIELLRWNVAGRALLITAREDGVLLASTRVVGVSPLAVAAQTRQMTDSATDQSTQQILMSRIVPTSELLVVSQFRLDQIKLLPF